jgi:hypothetical protein
MATVQGIREKVHLPIYDCVSIEPNKQLRDSEPTNTLKFFMNVQNKTKLETNLQSASLLPHYNTFEARAMRVVISDLPPTFSEDEVDGEDFPIEDGAELPLFLTGGVVTATPGAANDQVMANVTLTVDKIVELIREAKESEDGFADLGIDPDDGVEMVTVGGVAVDVDLAEAAGAGLFLSVDDLKSLFENLKDKRKEPLDFQIDEKNGTASIINRFIYNTVTTLYVGEKIMIQMPTWFFPSGAGAYSDQGRSATHGLPSPTDTFRFAEPIFIERQQNFRVEIEMPDSETLKALQRIYGPMFIWVVLDGYMTRGVQ